MSTIHEGYQRDVNEWQEKYDNATGKAKSDYAIRLADAKRQLKRISKL